MKLFKVGDYYINAMQIATIREPGPTCIWTITMSSGQEFTIADSRPVMDEIKLYFRIGQDQVVK